VVKPTFTEEELKVIKRDVVKLVEKCYPDIRKTINTLQKLTINGAFSYKEIDNTDIKDKFIQLLREKDVKSIRRDIIGNCDYEELYKTLFNRADEVSDKNRVSIMMTVGEYLYRHSVVVDPEINFVSMLLHVVVEANNA
jgi:hypothetical protein